jgi:hypothetical protein
MKKKIIIIASRSIFEFMPQDAEDYDSALLWRGIAQTTGFMANAKPKWMGTLSELVGQNEAQTTIRIFIKQAQ